MSRQEKHLELLEEAAKEGDEGRVALIINDFVNSEEESLENLTSGLLFSADEGHDEVVKLFLDHGLNINTKGFKVGVFLNQTALMRAAASGHHSTVKLLLERGANSDLQDTWGTTAMMFAAERKYPDIVSELLKNGADKNLRNSKGEKNWREIEGIGVTAYEIAERNGSVNVIKIFSIFENQYEILGEELYKAAQEGNSRLVRGLLVAGANLEYRDANSDQAIHKAADRGHNDVIRVLLDFGADVNSRGQNNYTPLHWAARSIQFTTVRLLIESGADMNLMTAGGNTALIWATKKNDLRTACELLDRGADKNIEKDSMGTASDLANKQLYANAIAILLSEDKISSDDPSAANVLFTATENGNVTVLKTLIRRGASIDITNKSGETPFQIATRFPKIKKQEYNQQLETFKKTGVKQKEPINDIIMMASKKSNDMAKIFIAQNLSHHDPQSISRRVSDIVNHVKSNRSSFCGQKFYIKFSTNDEVEETVLQSIVGQGLLKEREEVLDIMIDIDEQEHGPVGAEYRIKEEVKSAVSSSIGLRDCLRSVEEKFPWSKEKTCFMKFLSFFKLVVIGSCFYGFDVYTDIRFSQDMFDQANRNFSQERKLCMKNFHDAYDEAFDGCKINFTPTSCMKSVRLVEKLGEECFENEQRFSDPSDWSIAGTVSYLHCGLPILLAILIWEIIQIGRECGASSCFRLPLPFVTKVHKFLCDIELFDNYSWPRRNDDSATKKEYEDKKKNILKRAASIENIVNLSLIIEASVESSFQFFFQTVFALPNIVLTFTDPYGTLSWTEMFNWKTFSIILSFVSFAWAFYTIRYS